MGKGIVHNLDLLQSWAPTLVQRALAMAGESPVLAVHLPLSMYSAAAKSEHATYACMAA